MMHGAGLQLRPGRYPAVWPLPCPHNQTAQPSLRHICPRLPLLPSHTLKRSSKVFPRSVAIQPSAAAGYQSPFTQQREQDAVQQALANLPGPAVTVGAVVLVALTAAAGGLVGGRAPASWRTIGQIGGGLLGAAAGAFCMKQLQEKRLQAAGITLYNLLASKADPGSLTRQEVQDINSRFGVDLAAKLPTDVASLYGTYLESIIPKGDQPLVGNEADLVRNFKDALGITDEVAAPVHLDVGRRFIRSSYEAGSREANAAEKKTFQKLIFVSGLVFGEQKSAFLLPWRRTFKLTDSQLAVAKRDSAKALFKSFLDERGGDLQADRGQLAELRQYQQRVRLGDDVAADIVKEAARSRLEAHIDKAVEVTKRRTRERDYTDAITELQSMLQFNRQLDALAGEAEVVPGLGRSSVYGGSYDPASGDGKSRELRSLFRIYLDQQLKQKGKVDDALEEDLKDLQQAFALGPKEAEGVREEVISAAYRRLLRDEYQSGRLKAATSKAQVLQNLCEQLKYDSEAAMEVHKGIFTERLESFLEDEKLTDSEATELAELRKQLCLPADTVAAIEKATKGRIFKAAVQDALGAGIDGFTQDDRKNVLRVREAVRLPEAVAKEILKECTVKAFLGFITRSRNTRNRLDGAKELKKLVYFSNICVAPLLEDLQTAEEKAAQAAKLKAEREAAQARAKANADKEAAMKEFAATMAKAKEAADKAEKGEEEEEEEEVEEAAAISSYRKSRNVETPKAEEAAAVSKKEEGEAEAKAAAAGKDVQVQEDTSADAAPSTPEDERPATLAKAQDAAAARAEGEEIGATGQQMKSQKEVTLAGELELRDRTDIYRNFLLYCMSGDVVALPMGTSVVVERDASEFARLSQLGDILGLGPLDVSQVHQGLAEQSFRHQVQTIMSDGVLTPERSEALTEMRQKMGLSEEMANKVIKGVMNQRAIGNLQAAKSAGNLSIQKLVDLRESGVEVESFVSEDTRVQLFSKEINERLTDGSGDFDREALLEKLPKELGIPDKKVAATMKALAKDRRRTTLVQAISMLRQKKLDDAVKSVNNLMAVDIALAEGGPVSWEEKAELQDLYSIYISRESSDEKQAQVAKTLGISDSERAQLQQLVSSGGFKLEEEAQDANSFF